MEEFFQKIKDKFEKSNISTINIIPKIKLADISSKLSPAFNDPKYLPFYYKLGSELAPSNVLQIGSSLGLIAAVFTKSCKTVEDWFIVDNKKRNLNIVDCNVKLNYNLKTNYIFLDNQKLEDQTFKKFDLLLITEDFEAKDLKKFLFYFWDFLNFDSFLVVDFLFKEDKKNIFLDFCSVKNRSGFFLDTRYKIGIIKK
jgi:hypothetical protein